MCRPRHGVDAHIAASAYLNINHRSSRIHYQEGRQEARGLIFNQPITPHYSGVAQLGTDSALPGSPIGHLLALGLGWQSGNSLHGADSAENLGTENTRGFAALVQQDAETCRATPDQARCREVPHDGAGLQAGDR